MPVQCNIDIEGLSTEAFSKLDYQVMGHVFKCHNQFGSLADERIYESNLAARLNETKLNTLQQIPLHVSHSSFQKTYFLDLVVSRKGIYELKTVASLTHSHVAQLLTYLYLLNLPRGKLVNFRSPKVEAEFVNAPLSRKVRTSFAVDIDQYYGRSKLREMTVSMLLDLGTCLSQPLCQEILVHLLGGESSNFVMLPISDGRKHFGNQRFCLVTPKESLRVTCFTFIPGDYERQLQSLLQFSPLDATQWINIDVNTVTFKTIKKN